MEVLQPHLNYPEKYLSHRRDNNLTDDKRLQYAKIYQNYAVVLPIKLKLEPDEFDGQEYSHCEELADWFQLPGLEAGF